MSSVERGFSFLLGVEDFLLEAEHTELCRDVRLGMLLCSASIGDRDLFRVEDLDALRDDIRGEVAVVEIVSATDTGEKTDGEEADEGGEATTGRIKGT